MKFLALFAIFNFAQAEYKLVWQDNFDGNTLDTNTWYVENHCNPQNDEMQCYTPRTQNVFVKDGFLHVKAIPENYGNKKYTSGRLNTQKSVAWKYGKFEARAKLPRGDYLWPALWMMPRDSVYGGWAASGEIDIMEARGQLPRQMSCAMHYGGSWPNNVYVTSGARDFPDDLTADFHVYAVEWTRDGISFSVDGKVYYTQNLVRSWYSGKGNNPYRDVRQPFDQPFYYIINVAVGGVFFGGQSQTLTTDMARKWQSPELIVDYVRAYQDVGGNPTPIPQTTVVPSSTSVTPSTKPVTPPSTKPVTPPSTQPASTGTVPSSDPCYGKCGSAACCVDQRMGVTCYSQNTHDCIRDINGKYSLCGKGLGVCNTVCFDQNMYKCDNGQIRQK